MSVHPIEVESYRLLRERVDLSGWPDGQRDIVARVIHATADVGFADTMRIGAEAVPRLVEALAGGAPVVVDAAMVVAGVTRYPTLCYLPRVPEAPPGSTRSAAAFALAAAEHPEGAVWVVGNAPTALFELLRLHDAGRVQPAGVVGLPVGFVGAAESKAALWTSSLGPLSITNEGERGGSPTAVAAVNAALRLAAGP